MYQQINARVVVVGIFRRDKILWPRQRPVRLLCCGVQSRGLADDASAGAARLGGRCLGGGPAHSRLDNLDNLNNLVGDAV